MDDYESEIRAVLETPLMDKLVVCVFGMNGGGKTTLARRLAEIAGVDHVETGAIARRVSQASAETGAMAPDAEFHEAFMQEVGQAKYPLIIEGFPRQFNQLVLAEQIFDRPHYVHLITSPLVCIRRLLARGRRDDSAVNISNRIAEQTHLRRQVLDYLGGEEIEIFGNNDPWILNMVEQIENQRAERGDR